MVGVALITQAGFAGNRRYVALPAVLVGVRAAAAGWVELVRGARGRWGARGAALVTVLALAAWAPFVASDCSSNAAHPLGPGRG